MLRCYLQICYEWGPRPIEFSLNIRIFLVPRAPPIFCRRQEGTFHFSYVTGRTEWTESGFNYFRYLVPELFRPGSRNHRTRSNPCSWQWSFSSAHYVLAEFQWGHSFGPIASISGSKPFHCRTVPPPMCRDTSLWGAPIFPLTGASPQNFVWGDGFMGSGHPNPPTPQNLVSPRISATLFSKW